MKTAENMHTVLMIGNGRMGTDIGLQCAIHGKNVRYFVGLETPTEALEPIVQRQWEYLLMLKGKGYISQRVIDKTFSRMSFDTDIERICDGIDLAVEAVPETVEAKTAIWSRFAPYLPKDAILATNTSALLPSKYAEATGAPERFLAWHFATPAYIQNFVDIMPHEKTDPAMLGIMADFSKDVGLNYGILDKEVANYITINMLFSFFDRAFELMFDGYAEVKEIDKAWMVIRQTPIGPFGIIDKIGLPLLRSVYKARSDQSETSRKVIAYFDELIEQGLLGRISGHGFYDYPNPEFEQPDFVITAQKLS